MRMKFALLAMTAALAGCQHTPNDLADRGVDPVNVPVVTRTNYALDVAAPGGSLSPSEAARLDGWFQGLGLGYGDTIHLDGPDAYGARSEVAAIAGRYGMMVADGSPVTNGAVAPGAVRVIVSRNRVAVPGCPNWDVPSQPNYNNRTMSNFGCSVNANLAAQVANPDDLLHGRPGAAAVDASTGAKAIEMYRNWPLTAIKPGQELRTLKSERTSKEDK